MNRSKEMFKVTTEMGARLRELRLKAGVTQQELAVLMGRQGKGNAYLISRFESGHVPYPSFGFVADYLRACRASFNDIADLLNAYTFQPTVIEQRGYKRVRSRMQNDRWGGDKAGQGWDKAEVRNQKPECRMTDGAGTRQRRDGTKQKSETRNQNAEFGIDGWTIAQRG